MSSAGSLSKLLDIHDIDFAFISEHKLRNEHKSFLDSVHSNYRAITVCDTSIPQGARCGKGGVAIMYKKECQFSVSHLDIQLNDRILGIRIDQRHSRTLYAFSIYMPSVNYSVDEFHECIDYLENIYETFSEMGTVIFLGDFNCDMQKKCDVDDRIKRFMAFLEATQMSPVPLNGQFTFRPTCKTLDYTILDKNQFELIESNTSIDTDICQVSDHLPILTFLKVETITYKSSQRAHVAWNKCSSEHIADYQAALNEELNKLEVPRDNTEANVNTFYGAIVEAVHKASEKSLPFGRYNQHAKPYWTKKVKAAHQDQRQKRIDWIKHGRSRNPEDVYYKSYKKAKCNFRKIQKEEINAIELKYYSELDESAECDVRHFWHIVNSRRKTKSLSACKLVVEEKTANSPEEISDAFADHFSKLYIPNDHPNYDNDFKLHIQNKVKAFTNNAENANNDLICPVGLNELNKCLKDLKKRKSPGTDNITNEHILHGGPALLHSLKKLYCLMFELGFIPDQCKVGIIIPIHKPGKPRESPDSYRPITLISSFYKLFERIFLNRLQLWTTSNSKIFPSPQQNAYQKYLGSITVSFNLQETVAHNSELNADTYVASLDSSKAFDNVWHDGLFSKLHDFGITGKALNLIMTSYKGLSSYVLVNGIKSQTFPVKQGVRQGGVTSTWYYLLFLDGLLEELQDSGTGCTVGSIKLGNPTLADDLVLIGPNLKSLEKALKIVYEYSRKWRFLFNPSKCHLIIFSPKRPPTGVSVKFGPALIHQKESITHVGIELHQSMKSSPAIDARIQKGRSSLFSVLAIDRDTGFVSPSILKSLIEKICFPVVLYGAELWHNMSASDKYKLEKFIRFAAKLIQKFPNRTRTDIALGMLGWLPMSSLIEQRKLSFLHSLCTMPPGMLPRQVFDMRMNLFAIREYKNQTGFIPDVWKILTKYDLQGYIHRYLETSTFPSKYTWKTLCKSKIRSFYETAWHERVDNDADFARFIIIQPELKLSNIWTVAADKSSAHATFLVARLITVLPQEDEFTQCSLCSRLTRDINKHVVTACTGFSQEREQFLLYVKDHVDTEISHFLRQTDYESLYCSMLGARLRFNLELDDTVSDQFFCSAIAFLSHVFKIFSISTTTAT